MSEILIKNARILNEGQFQEADLLIKNGRIDKIAPDISANKDSQVIDATGQLLMSGMIDDQVHFRDPGLTWKGDINSESKAAIAGGITTFMDMPNVNPLTTSIDALEQKYQMHQGKSFANYAFYLGATNDNIEQIQQLKKDQTCGIKVFMGASTGNMLVDDEKQLERIFQYAPTLIATHCEDTPIIQANEAEYKAQYGEQIPIQYHPKIRSVDACWKSSSMAVELAKQHDSRLHVLHLTTAKEMALFNTDPLEQKRITAEACVHHLYYNDQDYATKGSFIKCNPAIKSAEDQAAILNALQAGKIDVIATDHAPHTLEEKQNRSYFKAPAGLPLVQYALPMLFELVARGTLTLEEVVQKACHNPAILFNIKERGFIREGYWADLILVDLTEKTTVKRQEVLYKCGWSPLEGDTLRGRIKATFVNGVLVYQDGQVLEQACQGMRLQYVRD